MKAAATFPIFEIIDIIGIIDVMAAA